MNPDSFLNCPICCSTMQMSVKNIECTEHSFGLCDGYFDLSGIDRYYGEIPQESMRSLLSAITKQGFAAAVSGFFQEISDEATADYLYNYIFSPTRVAWHFLASNRKRNRVLDLGSGWGTLLLPLAKVFQQAVGMDMTAERLAFTAARARHEGVENITLLRGGTSLPLPFADNSFDLVVLNGVLEWVPESSSGNPRQTQLAFLREIRRILAPDGEVYIGIENRLAYRYFLGCREDHTGLRFGALLPRTVSNLYSRVSRGKPYRTYTYSTGGYVRLLREAGFAIPRIVPVFPDYRFPKLFLGSNRRDHRTERMLFDKRTGSAKFRIASSILPIASRTALLHRFSHSFSIFAAPSTPAPGFIGAVLEKQGFKASEFSLGVVTSGETLQVIVPNDGSTGSTVFKFPLGLRAEQRLAASARSVQVIRAAARDSHLQVLIPCQELQQHEGRSYSVSPLLQGQSLHYSGFPPSAEREAVQLLHEFHSLSSRTVRLDESAAHSLLSGRLRRFITRVGCYDPLFARMLGDMVEELAVRMGGFSLDSGFTHGDFHAGNIICDRGRVTGVIDWDRFKEQGLQILDVYSFRLQKLVWEKNIHLSRVIADFLTDRKQVDEDLVGGILFLFDYLTLLTDVTHGLYYPQPVLNNLRRATEYLYGYFRA